MTLLGKSCSSYNKKARRQEGKKARRQEGKKARRQEKSL